MITEKFIRDSTFIWRVQRYQFWFRFWRRVVFWTIVIGFSLLAFACQFLPDWVTK